MEVRMIGKEELLTIVGSGNVYYEQAVLDEYSRDMSFVNKVKPLCVVKPRNTDDVKQLVNLANETLTPLVSVSSGPPHFPTRPRACGVTVQSPIPDCAVWSPKRRPKPSLAPEPSLPEARRTADQAKLSLALAELEVRHNRELAEIQALKAADNARFNQANGAHCTVPRPPSSFGAPRPNSLNPGWRARRVAPARAKGSGKTSGRLTAPAGSQSPLGRANPWCPTVTAPSRLGSQALAAGR